MEKEIKPTQIPNLDQKTPQEQMEEVATKWLDAFNEKNIENLLDLYADDAEHYSPRLLQLYPEAGGKIQGKDAMRQWWSGAFERLPNLQYEKISFDVTGDQVLIIYKRKAPPEPESIVKETLKIKGRKIVESRVLRPN